MTFALEFFCMIAEKDILVRFSIVHMHVVDLPRQTRVANTKGAVGVVFSLLGYLARTTVRVVDTVLSVD